MEIEKRQVIETSKGQLEQSQVGDYHFMAHEYLTHDISLNNIGELNILTLQSHLTNPYNTVNTSITPTLILHQLHDIQVKILIVDASSEKDLKPFKDLTVIKGTKISINTSVSKEQGSYMYSKGTIKQTLENNFTLSSTKPSFIGQFCLPQIDLESEYVRNNIQASFEYSKLLGCPVIFNMITGKNPTTLFQGKQQTSYVQTMYNKVSQILDLNKVNSNIIIINNPLLLFESQVDDFKVTKSLINSQMIQQLRERGVTIGYDLSRYQQHSDYLLLLVQEIKKFPDHTIIGGGILYKTDLKSFGGQGFQNPKSTKLLRQSIPSQVLTKVFTTNLLSKLIWKTKEIAIKQIEYWSCSSCGKVQAQDIKKFKKNEKEFCSTTCIRNFKF